MKLNVLVVDDDPIIVMTLTRVLQHLGHNVVSRNDGTEVFKLLLMHKFDLAMIDIKMPGPSGNLVVDFIKHHTTAGKKMPVLLISTLPEDELREKAEAAGADGWMCKPLRPEDIRLKLESLFSAGKTGGG